MSADTGKAPAAPLLLPCKVEEPVPKKSSKKPRKDPPATAVPNDAAGAQPTGADKPGKKRTASPDPALTGSEAPQTSAGGSLGEDVEKTSSEISGGLVVAKAVRTLLKNHTTPMHCGSDALPALNSKVSEIIYEAIGRALANGRKTLKNSDF
jgi:hypothetical protein